MRHLLTALLLLLCCSRPALAEDATDCVQRNTVDGATTLTNTCDRPIAVFWCHDSSDPELQDGKCASQPFYRRDTLLQPDAVENNPAALPPGAHITLGACYGNYASYKFTNDKGGYACLPATPAQANTLVMTSSASAPTAREACQRATAMAGGNGNHPGKCVCTAAGKITMCKVDSVEPAPASNPVNTARKTLRKALACTPGDKDCKPARSRNAGTGTRG